MFRSHRGRAHAAQLILKSYFLTWQKAKEGKGSENTGPPLIHGKLTNYKGINPGVAITWPGAVTLAR